METNLKIEIELTPEEVEALKKYQKERIVEGYKRAIDSYFTDYNKAFRNQIEKELEKQQIGIFKFPDLWTKINEQIAEHIGNMANLAVTNSVLSQLNHFFTGISNVSLSTIADQLYSIAQDDNDCDEAYFNVVKDKKHSWYDVKCGYGENKYEFTIHMSEGKGWIGAYGLESINSKRIKIKKDDFVIEIGDRTIFHDEFLRYIYAIVLSGQKITIDDYQSEWERGNDDD